MRDKERILEELAKEDLQLVALAYKYAKYMRMYGEDVTEAICAATRNAAMLDKAYRKGYYDAMKNTIDNINKSFEDHVKLSDFYDNVDGQIQ